MSDSEYFKKHVEELWRDAITSVDFTAAKTKVSQFSDSKLRRYFREAWRIVHLAKVTIQLSEPTGEPPQHPTEEQLGVLGTALAVLSVGTKRGLKYSQRAENKLNNEVVHIAKEFSAERRGKLVSIDKPQMKPNHPVSSG